jgi:hypothetical protein
MRYEAPVDTASLVGVFPLGLVFWIALAIAAAFPEPIETTGAFVAPHAPLSEKNLRPQFTVVSVAPTTWFSAAVTWFHLDFEEQLLLQLPSAESFIELDLSWMIRMSGGCRTAPWFTAAQFASGLDVGLCEPYRRSSANSG